MTDHEQDLALRRACLRRDWIEVEKIGRSIGLRLLIRALWQGLARLAAPGRLKPR